MVARLLLPLSPSEFFHATDGPVTSPRSWPSRRDRRRPSRWNDYPRPAQSSGVVDGDRVVSCIGGEAFDVAFHSTDQINASPRIVAGSVGQGLRDDPAVSIDSDVELLPTAFALSPVFGRSPFAFSDDREPGAIDDEMDGGAVVNLTKPDVQLLAPTREGV
jgi:hypothetical protein